MNIKNNEIEIREATLKDAPLLLLWWQDGRLMKDVGYPVGLNITLLQVRKQLESNQSTQLIIMYHNTPIGEMHVKEIEDGIATIGIKIGNVAYQNRGIGTRCLKMLISELFDQNIKQINVEVLGSNKRAQHVYEEIGFKCTQVIKDNFVNQLGQKESTFYYTRLNRRFLKQ